MKQAYFLLLPEMHLLDLAGPLQIMATVHELEIAKLRLSCIGPHRKLRSFQGVWLTQIEPLPTQLTHDDVLFVVGTKLHAAGGASPVFFETAAWLRNVWVQSDGTICGICTGAFLLAQAGLLDGRVCTTHHRYTERLRTEFPLANVVDNRIFVRDGNVLTSAGVVSGIDLAIYVVMQWFGITAALQVARENVAPLRRFGRDPTLNPLLRYRSHTNPAVHAVQDLITQDSARPMSCAKLAVQFGLSYRQLARLFREEAGITVKQYQMELRTEMARRLLAETDLGLEAIAERCGFSTVQAFRTCWRKRESATPSAYRRLQVREMQLA